MWHQVLLSAGGRAGLPSGPGLGLVETRQLSPFVTFFPFLSFLPLGGTACPLTRISPTPSSGARARLSGSKFPTSAHTHRPVPEPGKPSPTSCLLAPDSSCRVSPQYELLSQPALAAPLRSLKHSFLPGRSDFPKKMINNFK